LNSPLLLIERKIEEQVCPFMRLVFEEEDEEKKRQEKTKLSWRRHKRKEGLLIHH